MQEHSFHAHLKSIQITEVKTSLHRCDQRTKKLDKTYKKAGQNRKASKHNFTTKRQSLQCTMKCTSSVFVTANVHKQAKHTIIQIDTWHNQREICNNKNGTLMALEKWDIWSERGNVDT